METSLDPHTAYFEVNPIGKNNLRSIHCQIVGPEVPLSGFVGSRVRGAVFVMMRGRGL